MIGQAQRVFELKSLFGKEKTNRNGKILAFTSGKGGTGKSILSLNIAYALTKLDKKVLLIDLDLNFANLNILLNISPEKTIYDFYLSKSFLNEIIYPYSKNLDIIFGISGKTDFPTPLSNFAHSFMLSLGKLETEYDFIILDTAAGSSGISLDFLSHTDMNILVATPEPTAIMDAYVMIKLIKNSRIPTENALLINKCENEQSASDAFGNLDKAVQHFLKDSVRMLGWVYQDQLVVKSILNQELLLSSFPEATASASIEQLAEKLLEIKQLANIHHPKISSL